jgi:hypothetical protein
VQILVTTNELFSLPGYSRFLYLVARMVYFPIDLSPIGFPLGFLSIQRGLGTFVLRGSISPFSGESLYR